MLKTLKWVYDLGVKQERVRIAAHLQVNAIGAKNSINAMNNMFHEEINKPKPNKNRLERIDFDRAVNHQIEEIIQDNGSWVAGGSIMFPVEPEKK